jgi:hypothetical protein
MWFNFAHLFSMSLLPFSTAWMATSELAPEPVAFYSAVFFLVNATYICLIWELIDGGWSSAQGANALPLDCDPMRFRGGRGSGVEVSVRRCLIVYLKPEPPGEGRRPVSRRWRPPIGP